MNRWPKFQSAATSNCKPFLSDGSEVWKCRQSNEASALPKTLTGRAALWLSCSKALVMTGVISFLFSEWKCKGRNQSMKSAISTRQGRRKKKNTVPKKLFEFSSVYLSAVHTSDKTESNLIEFQMTWDGFKPCSFLKYIICTIYSTEPAYMQTKTKF